MEKKLRNQSNGKRDHETSQQLAQIAKTLDGITLRLNVCLNALLDILLSEEGFERAIPYTDKAAYLDSVGLGVDVISEIVGRPSNWVSSRLRESKLRKRPRRQRGKNARTSQTRVAIPAKE